MMLMIQMLTDEQAGEQTQVKLFALMIPTQTEVERSVSIYWFMKFGGCSKYYHKRKSAFRKSSSQFNCQLFKSVKMGG